MRIVRRPLTPASIVCRCSDTRLPATVHDRVFCTRMNCRTTCRYPHYLQPQLCPESSSASASQLHTARLMLLRSLRELGAGFECLFVVGFRTGTAYVRRLNSKRHSVLNDGGPVYIQSNPPGDTPLFGSSLSQQLAPFGYTDRDFALWRCGAGTLLQLHDFPGLWC